MNQSEQRTVFEAVACAGHKKAFDSYLKKLVRLSKAMEDAEAIFNRDVLPVEMEDSGDPKDALLWRLGVHNGMMILFSRSLVGKEQDIDVMVRDEMKKAAGNKYDAYDVVAYMEAAGAVCTRFGLVAPVGKGVTP